MLLGKDYSIFVIGPTIPHAAPVVFRIDSPKDTVPGRFVPSIYALDTVIVAVADCLYYPPANAALPFRCFAHASILNWFESHTT